MAGQVAGTPGFDLQPSAQRVPLKTNYITNFVRSVCTAMERAL